MDNNDASPTIEQSLKMIEEELKTRNKGKGDSKTFSTNTNLLKENGKIKLPLSNLFKKNDESKKKILKPQIKDDVLLLTKKIYNKGKVVDFKRKEKIKKINNLFSIYEEMLANPILDYLHKRSDINLIGKNVIENKNQ